MDARAEAGVAGLRIPPLAARLAEWPRGWRYAVPGSRDYRIDLLRGFLVVAMVVDHLGGDSLLTALTGDNKFLVSAAEGFIFISGLLLGIVYGGRVRRLGLAAGVRAALHRAAFLYVVVVGLTLAFVGLFLFTDFPLWMDRQGGLGPATPLQALVGAFTLHYTYNGTDILLIYVLLVGAAPLAFYLLASGRTAQLLVGSWLLWVAYLVFPEQATLPWPIANSVSFPLAAWQALFYTGLALGYHRARLSTLTGFLGRWPVTLLLALATAGLIALSQAHQAGRLASLGLPGLSDSTFAFLFQKTSLGPGRVLAFFVLAALAQQVVTRLWAPLVGALGWLLLPLGQKALLGYGTHLFLIGVTFDRFSQALFISPANPLLNTLIQLGLVLVVWALVKVEPTLAGALGQRQQQIRRLATATVAVAAHRGRG